MTTSPARSCGAFPQRPTPFEVKKIKEHINATGQPETYPLIETSKVENMAETEILADFQINRLKRPDYDLAPCPICSPNSPKYLKGKLVWFPLENCVRAVGEECGHRIDKGWSRKQWAFKIRMEDAAREDFLLENLSRVPILLAQARLAYDELTVQKRVWSELRKKAPALVQTLRAEMTSGQLKVPETVDQSVSVAFDTAQRRSKYRELVVGSVSGHTAVRAKFPHDSELKDFVRALDASDHGSDSETAGLAVCSMSKSDMIAVEKLIKKADTKIFNIQRGIADFKSFFSSRNLDVVNRWASHKNCPLKFSIKRSPSDPSRLTIQSLEFPFASIDLPRGY